MTTINCKNLTKAQINVKISKISSTELILDKYEYDDLEGIIFPSLLTYLSFGWNKITTFKGLVLPLSLKAFDCSKNKITSFEHLILPPSLTYFDCSNNKITSFTSPQGEYLILPASLTYFDCEYNHIANFDRLVIPSSINTFNYRQSIESIFNNIIFNSVFRGISERITFDLNKYNREQLIFLYLSAELSTEDRQLILDNL